MQKKKADGPTEPQQPAKKHKGPSSSKAISSSQTSSAEPPKQYTMSSDAIPMATKSVDPVVLKDEISAQGAKVKDLKSAGAEKVNNYWCVTYVM